MTTYLGKTCSFGLPRVHFINCCQFMYWVISLLVFRAGCGIWLYQFLIVAYLFTFCTNRQLILITLCCRVQCFAVSYTFMSAIIVRKRSVITHENFGVKQQGNQQGIPYCCWDIHLLASLVVSFIALLNETFGFITFNLFNSLICIFLS